MCGGQAVPESWMVLRAAPARLSLPLTQQEPARSQISAGCCSNDPEMRVFISICNPYIYSPSCRLECLSCRLPYRITEQVAVWKASQQPLPRSSRSTRLRAGTAAASGTWQHCSKEGFGVPQECLGSLTLTCCSQTDLPRGKAGG